MNRHFKTLELDKILHMLSEETSIDEAGELALSVEPQFDLDKVERLLTQTEDAHILIGRFGAPSFGGISNVTNALRRAEAGGCLNTSELLSIARALRVIKGVRDWHAHCAGVSTSLDGYFRALYTNPNLSDRITTCIIGADEISDGASRELADIRRKMRIAASKAREVLDKIIHSSTYQKYLQEAIITQRDGRYVVPVKQEFRSQVAGLVHDTSSSGSTVFIEPMGVVNANNDIRVLKGEEEKEIERILFELSGLCAGCATDIIESYKTLVQLNLIFAKAHLAYKMKAVRPVMNDSGVIELKAARHPLIPKDKVVPTDIRLGEDFDTLVITGPNTGGKTVCLKTLGLLTLMAMCGMMVPASDNSRLSVFRRVLVDIGDEQSIEQSLSTFSAHITNIIGILKLCNRSTLAVIDELGAGTDPVEGAALAVAILEKLRERGAKIAATTHYSELKEFALKTEGVENGCCEFDVTTLRPTYKLLIGVPGKSNAFAISKRLGMEDDVIERAKLLTSSESRQFENVVESLEISRKELADELERAREATLAAQQKQAQAEKELERAKVESKREVEMAKHKAQELAAKTRAQAYAIIDELEQAKKNQRYEAEQKAKFKTGMKALEETADPVKESEQGDYKLPRPLQVGDNVLIFDIDKKAVVLEKPEKDSVLVQAGIIKTRVKLNNLRLLEAEKVTVPKRRERTVTKDVKSLAKTEIDVRGQTAEEAIMSVDSALDSCMLSNIHMLTIIHGKGTGVLRSRIQQYLRHHKAVKSFRLGTFGEGESGVTIVELK
ncbi:endonuclease MutS2 [Ruminococcus sp.]|uniref:endonuclease MutS2 n=1 Tax=Ruminococcus sp. TaxID=41978 RepID=UPI002E80318F|nr:endonuclease MutS2 [Ruminococcus sp.]MEE3492708.1 endonuclease MutS2 [Ruminococcus sp.]